ncbi:fasciclin domain-containing protein [Pseudoruegeria sp. SK021]|uniref:fasciclin domain-containing protein n=1 Tax=Pseudoruegeria sp. SK021 TaxID=1933035 RepID=UPI000A23391E|nr:fasciclin domain-containing protein [Pseudoruegeria sp. SK021]OSP55012.1 hypothetical protein BV911_09265 [Pseudoruegeria sp. SK021]
MRRRSLLAFAVTASLAAPVLIGAPAFAESHSGPKDIVATAVDAGSFTTLVAAVEAAGLVETLQGEGPFTVFAPTDAAFAKLPEGTVDDLLNDIPTLTKILTYHVVPGAVMSTDLSDNMMAGTVEGSELTITTMDGVKVNDATVTQADIKASNGVIHVIDTVLMPAD